MYSLIQIGILFGSVVPSSTYASQRTFSKFGHVLLKTNPFCQKLTVFPSTWSICCQYAVLRTQVPTGVDGISIRYLEYKSISFLLTLNIFFMNLLDWERRRDSKRNCEFVCSSFVNTFRLWLLIGYHIYTYINIFVHGSTAHKAAAQLLSWLAQRFALQLKFIRNNFLRRNDNF